jgi:Ricin-type beta-trefoil lectin domain-like
VRQQPEPLSRPVNPVPPQAPPGTEAETVPRYALTAARVATGSNVASGMVLDAEDCETANGTIVRQWAQLDNTCQQWNITP